MILFKIYIVVPLCAFLSECGRGSANEGNNHIGDQAEQLFHFSTTPWSLLVSVRSRWPRSRVEDAQKMALNTILMQMRPSRVAATRPLPSAVISRIPSCVCV
ncbi:hypothetical protein B0J15DRAFT_495266 [Fusarium solani]|uniref:Secreted protein n=1 Tax=Fusarium solani TaxID=169388 RepID=A0A9P9H8D6_FUSSL|nr:uncharacterized protein B0J15DRAFT_495266 [Fusarium solani]KAH7252985.1 hypothetical protein B0J15DRAFT_495266 [Fusarium solani]